MYPPINNLEPKIASLMWFLLAVSFLWQAFDFMFDGTRNPGATESQRVNWQEHPRKLIERGHFHQSYHMSPGPFDILVEMLGNILVINEGKSNARSEAGPIIPEIRLHCLMRYLAGGSYLDICTLVSIPHSTFYYILWKTCDAINDCPELEFRLPNTTVELAEASAGFEGISVHGIMRGCIGAIDGWLLPIQVPPATHVGNVETYLSGHYPRHGFNIQAIVDHLFSGHYPRHGFNIQAIVDHLGWFLFIALEQCPIAYLPGSRGS
jgi:hypothetical protein